MVIKSENFQQDPIVTYETLMDLGKDLQPSDGYKKIWVHMIYEAKHDGCHKARLVADGRLTGVHIQELFPFMQ